MDTCFLSKEAERVSEGTGDIIEYFQRGVGVHSELSEGMPKCGEVEKILNSFIMRRREQSFKTRNTALRIG